ncbi:GGDEF domain-containing protein [Pseudoxanthomonas sp.]|uniref:GGDEF domain-containing protein n=1 Tax=Pseudoxanthomonas sp. TaxID=1871049 RepID=UPI0026248427|nr:GGDEF domain-containing protein [Pseudoxanthomonas sp.]WDS37922.1 MAG: GGDEF domain-containing protein [Pseudoxanthomonas sp.]
MSYPPESSSSKKGGLRRLFSRQEQDDGPAPPATDTPIPTQHHALADEQAPAPPPDAAAATAALMQLFSHGHQPEALLGAFADGICTLHGELRDMGLRLRAAFDLQDWPAYARALRQLIDKYIRTIDIADPGIDGRTEAQRLRELLRQAVGNALATLLQRSPALADEAQTLGSTLHHWHAGRDLAPLEGRLRELVHQASLHAEDTSKQQHLLLELFDLLLDNIGELTDDHSWLQEQVGMVRQLIAGPLDSLSIGQARETLREVIYRQGQLKQGIAESRQAMRGMMLSFVEQLGGMASSTGQYHSRIAGYAQSIGQTRSMVDLNRLLQEVLQDTAGVQAEAAASHEVLIDAQRQVEHAEQRIVALEQELRDLAELAREDQLTGALNRRGFDELFNRERARTVRSGQPLCLAMLDLDDFRRINEVHGHAGGDAALRHVVEVARITLRGTDAIARFGGEEFVLLLPDATIFEAKATVLRLQRGLAQHSFVHEDMRIFVTFSAGVAMQQANETQDALLRRADRAMYRAKKAGKSRVIASE